MTDLKNDPLEELAIPRESTIVTAFSDVPERDYMKTALQFFDLVCEESEARKRGECQSIPLEADVILEGVLDEDSSSDPV